MEALITLHGIEMEVHYDYTPASKGRTVDGLKIEPDEEEFALIEQVFVNGADIYEMLSDKALELIEEKIWEERRG